MDRLRNAASQYKLTTMIQHVFCLRLKKEQLLIRTCGTVLCSSGHCVAVTLLLTYIVTYSYWYEVTKKVL